MYFVPPNKHCPWQFKNKLWKTNMARHFITSGIVFCLHQICYLDTILNQTNKTKRH